MKLKYRIYFLSLLTTLLASSCVDNNLYSLTDKEISPEEYEEGYTYFDAFVDNFSLRTRNIQFEEGSSVRINSLWVGVFDINTGECVEKKETTQDYKFLTSGELARGVLRMKFDGPGSDYNGDGNFFMVAVANFNGVKARTSDNTAEETDLSTILESVTDWDDFNDIGVETTTAYAGDHNLDSPVLAGFLNTTDAYSANVKSSTHIKINQFADSSKGMVQLLPATLPVSGQNLLKSLAIKYNDSLNRYVDDAAGAEGLNHTIFFRRLIANINVNIVTPENSEIQITDVSYRRFNIPKMVYIIERSLLDNEGNFPTDAFLSPNFADMNPESGYYKDDDNYKDLDQSSGSSNSGNGQFSELDKRNWLKDNVTPNDDGSWTFSFQHFANKHWARKPLTEYADREKLNTDGSFNALADDKDDINNNASYFIVKMHLINPYKNRCSEAEYTIHEGYTSDSQGYDFTGNDNSSTYNETEWYKYILSDFSCARNINYTYNLRVNSFENLLFNVNGIADSENVTVHRSDIGGKVWQFNYVNEPKDESGNDKCNSTSYNVHFDKSIGDFTGAIQDKGGIFKKAIRIDSDKPNLAFRLYGYNSKKNEIEGYNYNFPDNSFSWLNGMWPESVGNMSSYFQDYDALIKAYEKDMPQIDNLLYTAFKIIDEKDFNEEQEALLGTEKADEEYENKWMDIVGFIKSVHDANGPVKKTYHMKVAPRQIDYPVPFNEKGNYIRALYVADRNGIVDNDGCTTLVNIYAAVQDPPTYNTFNATPIYKDEQYKNWQDNWNKDKETIFSEDYIYYANTSAGSEWTCNTNSVVNLGFKIEESFNKPDYNYKLIIKDNDGKEVYTQTYSNITKDPNNCIKLPLLTNWESVSAGVYDVILTLDDKGSEIKGNRELSFPSKLYLGTSSWSMGDTYWQRYTYTKSKDNRYFGFSDSYDTRGKNKYTKEKNLFMEYYGLELGVFETRDEKPFIDGTGYLNTMADYDPGSDSETPKPNIKIQPMKGKSYQLKFNVTKSGIIHLNVKNSNTNDKYWYFEFGDNIKIIDATFSKTSNKWEYTSNNNYQFLCKNDDAYDELKITYEIKDPKRTDGNEVKVYTRKDVLHLQKLWVTDSSNKQL